MAKKSFDGGVPDEESEAGEVVFESYADENVPAKEIAAVFSMQGFDYGDEIYFELDGVRKKGVISNIFYTKPSIDPPGSTDYFMIINVKDPESKSGQILQVECSLDDVTSDLYKIEKISDGSLN